jgi:hypothetical protein
LQNTLNKLKKQKRKEWKGIKNKKRKKQTMKGYIQRNDDYDDLSNDKMLTTQLQLVLSSRMNGAIPPLPQYAFMAWCSVKAWRQLYLYLCY